MNDAAGRGLNVADRLAVAVDARFVKVEREVVIDFIYQSARLARRQLQGQAGHVVVRVEWQYGVKVAQCVIVMKRRVVDFKECGEERDSALLLFLCARRRVQRGKVRASLRVNAHPDLRLINGDMRDVDLAAQVRDHRELGGHLLDLAERLAGVAGVELHIIERHLVAAQVEMRGADLGANAEVAQRLNHLRLQVEVEPPAANVEDDGDE